MSADRFGKKSLKQLILPEIYVQIDIFPTVLRMVVQPNILLFKGTTELIINK